MCRIEVVCHNRGIENEIMLSALWVSCSSVMLGWQLRLLEFVQNIARFIDSQLCSQIESDPLCA